MVDTQKTFLLLPKEMVDKLSNQHTHTHILFFSDEFMADIENQPPFGDLELDDPFSRPQISEEDKDEEDEISEEAKRAKWAERCNELFEDIKLEKVVKAVDEEEKVSNKQIQFV